MTNGKKYYIGILIFILLAIIMKPLFVILGSIISIGIFMIIYRVTNINNTKTEKVIAMKQDPADNSRIVEDTSKRFDERSGELKKLHALKAAGPPTRIKIASGSISKPNVKEVYCCRNSLPILSTV